MYVSNPRGPTPFASWLTFMAMVIFVVFGQPACGRSDQEITCIAYKYGVVSNLPSGELLAILNPGGLGQTAFEFSPPSLVVNNETHQAIQDEDNSQHDEAEFRLRIFLADATRELCRRTLEDEVPGFDFRTDFSNCGLGQAYDYDDIAFEHTTVTADDFDDQGPPVVLNRACHALCLLDDCSYSDTGGYDPPPEYPSTYTVHCKCLLEEVDNCDAGSSKVFPIALSTALTDDFCVPAANPADYSLSDYCRISVADYMNASVRTINYYDGIHLVPLDESCGFAGPANYDVVVRCIPVDGFGDIALDAATAYVEQNDGCAAGCSDLACSALNSDEFGTILGNAPCAPYTGGDPHECDPCSVSSACDCDILPTGCFENDIVEGVCLPELIGGADGGSDEGGGGSGRLKSAINLLTGTWLTAGSLTCSQIQPGGSLAPNPATPPPTSAVSPYTLTNGTSFVSGLLHTCPAPSTDNVDLSTFDTSLEELCRQIPLCDLAADLSLTITASISGTPLASGTLTKSGTAISTMEAGAPLAVGDHTVDLCVEHDPTATQACSAQLLRASAPLGSGVDGFGYFAGELASGFVTIAGKPGATLLALSDDGYQSAVLPSGFGFPFYGANISGKIWVGANGGINTTAGPIAAANGPLPASSGANAPDIAVYWDDLDPSSGGGVYTWFDGTRLIVSWEDVPHGRDSGPTTSNGVSVQAHIYGSGRIELHYLDTDVGDANYDLGKSATLGLGNVAGTEAVEVTYDSNSLLTSGVTAVGLVLDGDGCLADTLIIPPQVACTASDHYLTVCTPLGDAVVVPLPNVSQCAGAAVGVAGEVIESGSKESTLAPLSAPIPIDGSGNVTLDEGVHLVRWWPIDGLGEHVGPAFTQLLFAQTWVHAACGSSGRLMLVLTEDDDIYIANANSTSLALVGLAGEDVLVTAAGDDFIGDGPEGGICEANAGNDLLVGETGDDTLDCGPGDDRAWGGSGDDLLLGGANADMLDGQEGDDILFGGTDNDELWGGLGDDVLEGGEGADMLVPGAGIDAVYGGAGDDTIVILDPCELTFGQLLSGGPGVDTLLLPPGLDLPAVVAAGVTVDADIESVETSTELPTHRAACDPS